MPITVRIAYQGNEMVLPVNPEHIKVERASPGKTEHVIGIGDIVLPQGPELAVVKIQSAFYRHEIEGKGFQYSTAKGFADWFKIWQRSKQPAQWTVDELGYNLLVVCEGFDYDVKAGEEEDTYYELRMREYRPYLAREVTIRQATEETAAVQEPTAPPRADNAPAVQQTYTVKKGDSLSAITVRLGHKGASWRELYELNKSVIGGNANLIYPGQVLTLPQGWVTA